jgi:hypothetical protein
MIHHPVYHWHPDRGTSGPRVNHLLNLQGTHPFEQPAALARPHTPIVVPQHRDRA